MIPGGRRSLPGYGRRFGIGWERSKHFCFVRTSPLARPTKYARMSLAPEEGILDDIVNPEVNSRLLALPRAGHVEDLDPLFLHEPLESLCGFIVQHAVNLLPRPWVARAMSRSCSSRSRCGPQWLAGRSRSRPPYPGHTWRPSGIPSCCTRVGSPSRRRSPA